MTLALLLACARGSDTDSQDRARAASSVTIVHDFNSQRTTHPDGLTVEEPCSVEADDGVDYAPCCPPGWVFLGLTFDGVACGLIP